MTKPIGWVLQYEDGTYAKGLTESAGQAIHTASIPLGKAVQVYAESPPETLSIRDEAELRILAALYSDPNSNGSNEQLIGAAKRVADLWMKARTV